MSTQTIIQGDCLEVMKTFADKSFDLVLTDPPYGIGYDKGIQGMGTVAGRQYEGNWDSTTPPTEVFQEIMRVARKTIIFGGQFFADKLPANGHWIVWDKKGDIQFDNHFGDCELAWTNIPRKSVTKYTVIQQGFIAEEKDRWHPTQKPVSLFERIIKDYSEGGDILDCFLGSGTTLIASKNLNRNAVGIEISPEYCAIAQKRLDSQPNSLFA